jgi:hypothetical protein
MLMRARRNLTYDGRNIADGEVFAVGSEADRRVLITAQLAADEQNGVQLGGDDPTRGKKGRYRRRDVRAEE